MLRATQLGIIGVLVLTASISNAAPKEADYVSSWCSDNGGKEEYRLRPNASLGIPGNARVDCLLPDLAIEFDWGNKWAECVGQASYYGTATGRQGACMLIRKSTMKSSSFKRYVDRARVAMRKTGIRLMCINAAANDIPCP